MFPGIIKFREEHTEPPTRQNPFIVMVASAKMPGNCKGPYGKVAVVETTGETMPRMISERARGVVRIVRLWDRQHIGETPAGAFQRAFAAAENLSDHLNLMRLVRLGEAKIEVSFVERQRNEELRRELLDAYPGGLLAYMQDAGAIRVHTDAYGTLWAWLDRHDRRSEAIVMVEVICPTTGRRYGLRVPPGMTTAKEAVAWTFGLRPNQYRPSIHT